MTKTDAEFKISIFVKSQSLVADTLANCAFSLCVPTTYCCELYH